MSDDLDLEEVGQFRVNLRPWFAAFLVNVTLGGLLLGYPYFRGPSRAREVPSRFAAFAECFFDAEALGDPGLGFPPGERERYSALVLGGDEDWPARCAGSLAAIPAEESMFLFPGVKNAEAEVRAGVALMTAEMEALAERRAEGASTVSDRPMRAMARLRGALAELGVSARVEALAADRDAIRFPDALRIPRASIIPLRVSEGGEWSVRLEAGALLASTMDTRALVRVRVEDGDVDQRVTRRRLVRAILGAEDAPWLVWSTSPSQCAQSDDRCARRATGLAALLEDRQTLEPMFWLGAHPLGSPSRSVHVRGRRAWVVGPKEGEGISVEQFELPEPTVRALGEEREVPRLDPSASWDLPVGASPALAWLEGDPPRLLFADSERAGVVELSPGIEAVPMESPGGAVVVDGCGPWRVVVGRSGARLDSDLVAHRVDVDLDPLEPGSLRAICHPDWLELWTLAGRHLSVTRCASGGCAEAELAAEGVSAFDVIRHGAHTFLAWTDHADEGAVRFRRADEDIDRVPAPCWTDPMDGLCGEPRLASDGATLMVVTRQDEDLRAVRSRDGVVFESLLGE